MDKNGFDIYAIKIGRLTHLEKMLGIVNGFFLGALYFIFRGDNSSMEFFMISTIILICTSIGYIHILLISISYVIDIVETESQLGISHVAKMWSRLEDNLRNTYFFISFSPSIITIFSIILLAYKNGSIAQINSSAFISLVYLWFIRCCALKPFLDSAKSLKSIFPGTS